MLTLDSVWVNQDAKLLKTLLISSFLMTISVQFTKLPNGEETFSIISESSFNSNWVLTLSA